ncbi:MAG: sugar phosphate isomerase/epimerase [Lachnospiraceae bacterium]|nr:sugar phosphate isomerase/epimerase [Lachnospiraceae bacterium]
MNLSISNIAWKKEQDEKIYRIMRNYGIEGLEIAPTRVIAENPYDSIEEAKTWYNGICEIYKFSIPSMQSIWYGRKENIFGSEEERHILFEYTKKAIDFAEAIHCKNLVFGCPKNRYLPDGEDGEIAVSFFRELGDYAMKHNTVIGMEANPVIYNTNYINDTASAIELIRKVGSEGFKLNLDIGTMICNEELVEVIEDSIDIINHVHISEPELKPLRQRMIHNEIIEVLRQGNYKGFVSIEMGTVEEINIIEESIKYIINLV